MDGARFDHLARALAGGLSRRRLFRSIAAGIAASLPFTSSVKGAAGAACTSDLDCVGTFCCAGACSYGECCDDLNYGLGNPDCPGGQRCSAGFCYTPDCQVEGCSSGICCNGLCRIDFDCCPEGGYFCGPGLACIDGYCYPSSCSNSDDCDGSLCCDGICDAYYYYPDCCPGDSSNCPSGYLCDSGGSCYQPTCSSDADCVSGICCGGICNEGIECCPSSPAGTHCASGYTCVDVGNGAGYCASANCSSNSDCSSGVCCQDGSCYDGDCCPSDSNPNPNCPYGLICFEGYCTEQDCRRDGDCIAGICCDGVCANVACCAISPRDGHCPSGSFCAGDVCVQETTCTEDSDCGAESTCSNGLCAPTASATATATATPDKPTDKWKLWSDPEIRLQGAVAYLRRVTKDDDPATMGRGVIGPQYSAGDFKRLAGYGANYVELSHPAPVGESAPYTVETTVGTSLSSLVNLAGGNDLYVVIALRTGPGRGETTPEGFPICRAGGCFGGDGAETGTLVLSSKLWDDDAAQAAWVNAWSALAKEYAKNPVVIGYHLMAMPDAPTKKAYAALLNKLVTAIRKEDPETPILVSVPGGGEPGDLTGFEPLDAERIVYRFETFGPKRYLRQTAEAENPLTYGEEFELDEDGEEGVFDRAWLRDFLRPAQNWAKETKQPVTVGGYGIPRWQPGLEGYLDDLLELFGKYQWTTGLWMWHPATGPTDDDTFNLEHGADPENHKAIQNPLLDLIIQYWKANKVRLSTGT